MSPTPHITHVIFDLDGTLLDTEPLYIRVQNEILAPYGKRLDPAVRARMLGAPGPVSARIFVEGHDVPMSPEAFLRERTARLAVLFPYAQPMPGAVALTQHLAAYRVPMAIATSSDRESFALKAGPHRDWFACIAATVVSNDVEHGKPAPDIFLAAAERIGATPAQCLVFEDAPNGVQAALAAGMAVIALPEADYVEAVQDAHGLLHSLEAFDPAPWGLPPFPAKDV